MTHEYLACWDSEDGVFFREFPTCFGIPAKRYSFWVEKYRRMAAEDPSFRYFAGHVDRDGLLIVHRTNCIPVGKDAKGWGEGRMPCPERIGTKKSQFRKGLIGKGRRHPSKGARHGGKKEI